MHIFLVYGGKSPEHDVSVNSAASFLKGVSFERHTVTLIYITQEGDWLRGPLLTYSEKVESEKQLKLSPLEETAGAYGVPFKGDAFTFDELKEPDSLVFPLLHGPNGEDGTVQGLLELLDVPYAGPGVVPCACGMDKIISKDLFAKAGIPQTEYFPITEKEWEEETGAVLDKCENELSYPIYIKPANMGSSIGITEANSREDLVEGFNKALRYDRRVVVEQGIEARELNVAIIGNTELKVSIVGELVKDKGHGFYDYEDKYIKRSARQQYPTEVTEKEKSLLQEYSLKGFQAIDGNGMGRADLFMTEDGKVYLNEFNLIPGFFSKSIFACLWEHSGLPYTELIEELIRLGMEQYESKKRKDKQVESV